MLTKKNKTISASIGFCIGTAYLLWGIFHSTNSTSSVGVLFIPVFGGLGALLGVLSYYMLKKSWTTRLIYFVVVLFLEVNFYRTQHALDTIANSETKDEQLLAIHQTWFLFGREKIMAALAQSPVASSQLLETLAQENSISVLMKVAANPNTPEKVLKELSLRPLSDDISSGLASNPNIPADLIQRFLSVTQSNFKSETEYKLYIGYTLGRLALNPRITEADFLKLVNWPESEYFLVYGIIESPRVTCEQLKAVNVENYLALQQNKKNQMTKKSCQ